MPLDTRRPKKSSWMAKAFGDDAQGPSGPGGPKPPAPAAPEAPAAAEATAPPAAPAPRTPESPASPASEPPAGVGTPPELAAPPKSKKTAKRAPRTAPASAPAPAAAAAGDTNDGLMAPPMGAKQPERFQCRISTVVSERVARTEQLIAARTDGLSLNTIREIMVWDAMADPSNAERFLNEVLPRWYAARTEATIRAASDAA